MKKQEQLKQEAEQLKLIERTAENKLKYEKYKRSENYEENKLKQRQKSLDWYYRNREYVLDKQSHRKCVNSEYYKEWYAKNKRELNMKRCRNTKHSSTPVSSKLKHKNVIIPKPFSFSIIF